MTAKSNWIDCGDYLESSLHRIYKYEVVDIYNKFNYIEHYHLFEMFIDEASNVQWVFIKSGPLNYLLQHVDFLYSINLKGVNNG